jgi:hypothetical protein
LPEAFGSDSPLEQLCNDTVKKAKGEGTIHKVNVILGAVAIIPHIPLDDLDWKGSSALCANGGHILPCNRTQFGRQLDARHSGKTIISGNDASATEATAQIGEGR